jgi:hypothetical protein
MPGWFQHEDLISAADGTAGDNSSHGSSCGLGLGSSVLLSLSDHPI